MIMGTVERVAVGIVGIGLVTTILLRPEAAERVLNGVRRLFTGSLGTAITGKVQG